MTRQPYQAGSRIENGVPHGAEFERRVGTILEDGCPPQQPDDPGTKRHEDEESGPRDDRPIPPTGDCHAAGTRQEEHEERPHQLYGGG